MKGAIILDFNRTIYDPDKRIIAEGALDFLERYSKDYHLALIIKDESRRQNLIEDLGIRRFFKRIIIKQEKEESDFIALMKDFGFRPEENWTVGDRVKKEIRICNKLGIKTIWFRNGKFADEMPSCKDEEPDYTVRSFKEIADIILLNTPKDGC